MSKLMALISASAHLRWASDFLFSNLQIFNPNRELCFSDPSIGLITTTTHYCKSEASPQEDDDDCCSICLIHMKQRQEVSKLRCNHLFHRPCLDRWFQSRGGGGGLTCPLCRDNSLFRPREALAADDGVRVLELRLVGGDSGASDDQDSWWLR